MSKMKLGQLRRFNVTSLKVLDLRLRMMISHIRYWYLDYPTTDLLRLAKETLTAELAKLVSHLTERLTGQEDGNCRLDLWAWLSAK